MELIRRALALAAIAASFAALADAAVPRPRAPACPVAGTRAVSFARLSDGGFVTETGEEIRLAGIVASDRPQSLRTFLTAGALTVAAAAEADRYGRTLANVFAGDVWVQGALIRAGEARALPEIGDAACAKALFAAEDEARSRAAGHWGDRRFDVLSPEQLRGRTGRFEIVAGTVVSAGARQGRAYINFGADYRNDFTITVAPDDMPAFRRARLKLDSLAGRRVRVRGWLEFYNGPEMEIASPLALEMLDAD